ncbi:AAA family ATPase [Candidatus Bathyarchaeota archaeon]|nr:AAA family ATPase [Candidatus Bathyarchaeota archaeon]
MAAPPASRESVFKDPRTLHPDYIPPKAPFREHGLEKLRVAQRFSTEKPAEYRRIFITGGYGTGKTLLARLYAATTCHEQHAIYVNCIDCRGKLTFLLHGIVSSFKPIFPRRGYSVYELKESLANCLRKNGRKVLLIIDDLDMLLHESGAEGWEGLQDTLKLEAFDSTLNLTVYTVNRVDLLDEVGFLNRTLIERDRFELKRYSKAEVEAITCFRARLAFREEALEQAFLSKVAEQAFSAGGNLAYAMELMLKAGELADSTKSRKITLDHLEEAEKTVHPRLHGFLLEKLEKHEKILLLSTARTLKRKPSGEASLSEVEREYRRLCQILGHKPRGHTTIFYKVKTLSLLGFTTHRLSGSGYRGKTTLLSLPNIPPNLIESKVAESLGLNP